MFSAELRFSQRVYTYVVKNMTCNVTNDYAGSSSSQEDIVRRQNRRFQFPIDYSSVLKNLKATQCFTTVIAKAYFSRST